MTPVPKGAWIGPFYELMLLYNNVAKLRQNLGQHASKGRFDQSARLKQTRNG
jgi:hypothetical protein